MPDRRLKGSKTMTVKHSGLTLALAVAVGAVTPALAGGDVIYQGYKDPAAAVPVPAPIPIEEYAAEYYIRADVAGSCLSDANLGETGTRLDIRDVGDVEAIEWGSLGFGRYVTPSIRVELAVDLGTKALLSEDGFSTFRSYRRDHLDDGTIDTSHWNVQRTEEIKFEQDFGFLNAYYDIHTSSRFTPYVGAGLGVAYRQLSRTSSETAECHHIVNSDTGRRNCAGTIGVDQTETEKRWDIAVAAMAGFAYKITDDILWDTGYRYIWTNGSMAIHSDTVSGTSKVEIGDVGQHQVRTGVRLNIN